MIKKLFLATALCSAVALGGCATTTTGGVTTTPDISAEIAQVQKIATQVCGFLPAASTVSGIIASFVPGAAPINGIATQVANAICGAVTAKSVKLKGAARPTVNGVAIYGNFVR